MITMKTGRKKIPVIVDKEKEIKTALNPFIIELDGASMVLRCDENMEFYVYIIIIFFFTRFFFSISLFVRGYLPASCSADCPSIE